MTAPFEQTKYDVALSFAGEDRHHARLLAKELIKRRVAVFYDEYEQASLWGSDLPAELHDIYSSRTRFVVIFVSRDYARKKWTAAERKAAQQRALDDPTGQYILPVRIDGTNLPGLATTLGYVSIELGVEKIADLLLEKLGPDRVQHYLATLPKYGGTASHVLSKHLVEDLTDMELVELVDDLMRSGHMVEFPRIEFGKISVVPRMNVWPGEEIELQLPLIEALAKTEMTENHTLESLGDGYRISCRNCVIVDVRLDSNGTVVRAELRSVV